MHICLATSRRAVVPACIHGGVHLRRHECMQVYRQKTKIVCNHMKRPVHSGLSNWNLCIVVALPTSMGWRHCGRTRAGGPVVVDRDRHARWPCHARGGEPTQPTPDRRDFPTPPRERQGTRVPPIPLLRLGPTRGIGAAPGKRQLSTGGRVIPGEVPTPRMGKSRRDSGYPWGSPDTFN
jgi:hypothetical protein